MNIAVLCGGVGGSKLVLGVHLACPDAGITVVVNTGDDLEILGLRICPDLDTVMYTLARLVNRTTGWGVDGDSFRALEMLKRYAQDSWFNLGDRDLATHLVRTARLNRGGTLTEATDFLRGRLGVREAVLPMSDEDVRTRVRTAAGWLTFQEYFVKRSHADVPLEVDHAGIDAATPTESVRHAVLKADLIIAAPSNPVVSLGPMLSLPGFTSLLRESSAPKVAISPFIGYRSITGPADALMRAVGYESTSLGLATMYQNWLTELVIDRKDHELMKPIQSLGIVVHATDTLMTTDEAKRRLAAYVVNRVK